MVSRFLSIALLITLVASTLFLGCRQKEESNSSTTTNQQTNSDSERHTLRLNLGAEPETMSPLLNISLVGSRVLKGLLEGPITLDENSQAIPAGASSWEHNDDYTVWTFHLRPEAKWRNGDPVTAHDYVYAMKRLLTPTLAAEYAKVPLSLLKGADEFWEAGGSQSAAELPGISAADDFTLVYTLKAPTTYFDTVIDLTCWYPVHPPTVKANPDSWYLSPETFVGNGPFILDSYKSRDRAILKKSPTYWDKDNIFWETVECWMIASLRTETQAFEAGDIDITHKVSLADVEKWKKRPEWNTSPSFGTYYISVNTTEPPFDDVRVRKAFSMVIDRDFMVNKLTRRGEIASKGLIPASLPSPRGGSYRDHAPDYIGKVDVDKAIQLIQQAGYSPKRPLPKIEYIYDSADDHKMIGELLQNMWSRAFNVDVRLQNVDWGTRLEKGAKGSFQIIRNGWYGDYMDAMTFMELFESDSPMNRPRMKNERYDELIAAARLETDLIKREDLFIEAEGILIEQEAAIIPLFTYAMPILVQPDIQNLVRNATGDLHYQRANRQ